MRKLCFAALAALWGLALPPGESSAATADGTLITNVACATFMAAGGQGFSVSYCATVVVPITSPCIALQKIANPTVQSSGGTVTFTIWMVNCSCTQSAFNITMTDRLPDNMSYAATPAATWAGGSGGTFIASAGSSLAAIWPTGEAAVGQTSPYFLRWTLTQLGPCVGGAMRSASVTFLARVL